MNKNYWQRIPIVNLCETHVDCVNRTAPLAEAPTEFKMIRTTNVRDGFIDVENVRYVDEPTFHRWTRRLLPRKHDVILTREAPLGEVGMLRSNDRIFLGQRLYHFRADPDKLDPHFLLYSLLGEDLQGQIRGFGSGSTVEHMRLGDIPELYINAPPIETQRKIAGILSAYDDLIENNLRRIKILEQMAQSLYREWFLHFRFPGHESATFKDSELGRIPEGWAVKEMQEVAEVIDCLHSKKPTICEDAQGVLLQLSNIGDGGKLDMREQFRISDKDYRNWTSRIELHEGDCLVTNVGRVGAVAQIPEGVKAAPGRNMTAIRARPGKITQTCLIEYLLSPHMVAEVSKKKDIGTIMDSLNVKGIIRLHVPSPPFELNQQFENLARPIRQQIEILVKKNQTLRRTRDLLLPKLLSGGQK
jgi:type I restriction enzyme S subunit